jgi:hypothetical protein
MVRLADVWMGYLISVTLAKSNLPHCGKDELNAQKRHGDASDDVRVVKFLLGIVCLVLDIGGVDTSVFIRAHVDLLNQRNISVAVLIVPLVPIEVTQLESKGSD